MGLSLIFFFFFDIENDWWSLFDYNGFCLFNQRF